MIQAGTELTTHYKLDMDEASRYEYSRWYFDLWEKISKKNEEPRPVPDEAIVSGVTDEGSKSGQARLADGQDLSEAVGPRQADGETESGASGWPNTQHL